jgi:hypothetical protein
MFRIVRHLDSLSGSLLSHTASQLLRCRLGCCSSGFCSRLTRFGGGSPLPFPQYELFNIDTLDIRDTSRSVLDRLSKIPLDEKIVIDFSGISKWFID